MTIGEELSMTVRRLDTCRRRMLSSRIKLGWPVTGEYREYCLRRNLVIAEGVLFVDSPAAFPIRNPMQCRFCGIIYPAERVESDEEFRQCTFRGRAHRWEDSEPDEYETICPDCRSNEGFDKAICCAECDEYPCVCEPEDSARHVLVGSGGPGHLRNTVNHYATG